MFADTILYAVLGSLAVTVGSIYFGPKYGPEVRGLGFKVLVLALVGKLVLKAVS